MGLSEVERDGENKVEEGEKEQEGRGGLGGGLSTVLARRA